MRNNEPARLRVAAEPASRGCPGNGGSGTDGARTRTGTARAAATCRAAQCAAGGNYLRIALRGAVRACSRRRFRAAATGGDRRCRAKRAPPDRGASLRATLEGARGAARATSHAIGIFRRLEQCVLVSCSDPPRPDHASTPRPPCNPAVDAWRLPRRSKLVHGSFGDVCNAFTVFLRRSDDGARNAVGLEAKIRRTRSARDRRKHGAAHEFSRLRPVDHRHAAGRARPGRCRRARNSERLGGGPQRRRARNGRQRSPESHRSRRA